MVKKVRNFVDKEEMKTLARYTPKEISALLDAIGGMDKFNTGDREKSIVNMYGHLHGHIQRGVNDLETMTNSLLRQKTDVGAFVRGQNAYSIVKCSFKDSTHRPKTVSDVKLSVNILDSELISPIFHYQVTVEYLIKDMLSKHILDLIDKEIEGLKEAIIDEGREEMSDGEILFEKMKRVQDFKELAKRKRNKIKRKIKALTGDPMYEDIEKTWDEVTFVVAGDTEVERMNRTYLPEKDKVKRRIILMREKLQKVYSYKYPIQRRVAEERLNYLEAEFNKFDYMINPYHIQPGLILDVDITSIKKKKATLEGMANVLNEFLFGVSKGFADAAFASFSRRRSTVREDIAMSFGESGMGEEGAEGSEFVDMIHAGETAASQVSESPRSGVVDSTSRGRGRPKGSGGRGRPKGSGRGRSRGSSGLKEI
jgi:hypothetical protein